MLTITLDTSISQLPLVGPQLTKGFYNMGIETVEDLLFNFPIRYMDYRKTVTIAKAEENEIVTISGRIKSIRANLGFRTRLAYAEATIEDGTGSIKAIWFNQTYIAKQLTAGDEIILSGKVGRYKTLQLTNPAYELLREDEDGNPINLHTGRLVPIYRRSDLIPLRTMRRLVKLCLPSAENLDDFIPNGLLHEHKLLPIAEAIQYLHFPETEDQVAAARFRIAVDDILPQQLAVQIRKSALSSVAGFKIDTDIEKVKLFLKSLPFELTPSQKRAAWDIFQDLESGKPMNRLLQGDVGSGKTIVAILSALQAAGNKVQTVILAPTEILAKQHYDTFGEVLGSKSGVALLTRTFADTNDQPQTKAELEKMIAAGKVQICIGTHALLQQNINFKNLGLVIVDEQHRFGVGQRSLLLKDNTGKGKSQQKSSVPHLLSMSATPIPRTLAMSLYADLVVSVLSHVPSGRKAVQTEVLPESGRDKAYDFIRQESATGHQSFIVTPRVEESALTENLSEVRSVKKEFARLQKEVFPNLKLGLLYGKMKGVEKEKVMAEFASGKLDILVATSVIEIGIDIPKATAMIIEGSERFGLAQLHQLRGRIGRNNLQSKCFLFTTEASHQETARLQALAKTTDGFALAELDLQERGFGDLFGKQQSGFAFKYPQFMTVKALKLGHELAVEIMETDQKLVKQSQKLTTLAYSYLEEIHNE